MAHVSIDDWESKIYDRAGTDPLTSRLSVVSSTARYTAGTLFGFGSAAWEEHSLESSAETAETAEENGGETSLEEPILIYTGIQATVTENTMQNTLIIQS